MATEPEKPNWKNRADILAKQCEAGRNNWSQRRGYEWKLGLAIWAALATFIAFSLKGEVSVTVGLGVFLALMSVVLLALHFFFLYRVHVANAVDKGKADLYEALLDHELHLADAGNHDNESVKAAADRLNKVKKNHTIEQGRWNNRGVYWSVCVHVCITTVLLASAAGVLWLKTPSASPPAVKGAELQFSIKWQATGN
ncbi:MAG: hypothetical protein O7D91_06485 [Planctomycetota bacterium]|nr:hypothetical protein [Planctomycetota bacterium]